MNTSMPNAVITGGTRGIGRAIAIKLLAQGCNVAICARDGALAIQLQQEWSAAYPNASVLALEANVASKTDVDRFASFVLQQWGRVDIVVNNAGVFLPGELATEPDGRLEELMSVNLYSAYYLTRALLPAMKQNDAGHIFNMCSVASLRAYANGGSYSISKYALLGFSDNLREELKPHNIKVTAISPGATYTSSWDGSGVPQERIMEATDVAEMLWAAYGLSPQANVEHIVLRPVKGDL